MSHLNRKTDDSAKELIWKDVPVKGLQSGDILGSSITSTNGHVFLVTGTRLSDTHIDHLRRLVTIFEQGQHRFVEPISVAREKGIGRTVDRPISPVG